MATRDPFTSGLAFGSNLIAGQAARRQQRADRAERERLRDLGAQMSLAVEQGYLEFDKDTALYKEGPRFNENSPVINETRTRLINLSPAFSETLKFDGDKQGRFAGETPIGGGNAVLDTDTGDGISQITLKGTSAPDDEIVVVPEGFSNSMAELALFDLNLDLDPTSIQRSQLARNIQEQDRVSATQKKEILDILSSPEISREEKTLLLSDYYEETQQADDPAPDSTDAPAPSTTDKRKASRAGTGSEPYPEGEGGFFTNLKNKSDQRKLDNATKKLNQANERLATLDENSALYKGAKRTKARMEEIINELGGKALEESVATSKVKESPDPDVLLQDSESMKQEFLQELEGKSLDDLTRDQQELIRTDRVNDILKKYGITNINELSQNNKIKMSELRTVGVSLARQIAITEARRLGNTDMTSIGNYAQNVYTAIWGGIVAGDMNLTPQSLAEHQLKIEEFAQDKAKFLAGLTDDSRTRAQAYQQNLGDIAELLYNDGEKELSNPRSPKGVAKIRNKIITMERDAKRAIQAYQRGNATPDDYEAISAYKDALVLLARAEAYNNRDTGVWTSFIETLFGIDDFGQRDLDASGSYYKVSIDGQGNFNFGSEQLFTKTDMRKLFGDSSSETLELILTDESLLANLRDRANASRQ